MSASAGQQVNVVELVARVEPFAEWPRLHVRELCASIRVFRFPAAHMLIGQGQKLAGLYVIGAGVIEVGSTNADGRRYVRRFAQPGTLFGLLSILDDEGSPYFYAAHEPSTVLFIPKGAFLATLARHPEQWESIARFVAKFQRKALNAIDENIFVPLRSRLARTLLLLANADGTQVPDCMEGTRVRIAQHHLASLVGVSRQSISKELKRFAKEDMIQIEYGSIKLVNLDAVKRMAHY